MAFLLTILIWAAAALPVFAAGSVSFDDLVFSKNLGKVIVPAGDAGKILLIDPVSYTSAAIEGLGTVTSADDGDGFIFTADHRTKKLEAVDLKTGRVAATADLAAPADYVRYVEGGREVWVTQPRQEQIEVFSWSGGTAPNLSHAASIPVPGGPESLIIDQARERAYTNLWQGKTAVIDLQARKVTAEWTNGCAGSRGLDLDPLRGFLFAGCAEGRAVVLDVDHDGRQLGSLATGPGADVISYNPDLAHLYLTSSKNAELFVLKVSAEGGLSLAGKGRAAAGSHCVAGDDHGNIWVCDPEGGRLLRYRDTK